MKGHRDIPDKIRRDITIVDCAPRDGLSKLPKSMSTLDKVSFINHIAQAGIPKIDCVGFTHPRMMPRDSDAAEVIQRIEKKPGVTYVGLANTEIGCRRAIITDIDEVLTGIAASEVFNQGFRGCAIKKTLNKDLPAIFETAAKSGKSIRTFILTAFGCPYAGKVPIENVVQLASKLSFLGATELSLVDTTGMANPRQVKEMVGILQGLNLSARFAVHFHNTRGTALANCWAAYEAGVRIFDTAVGGLSGPAYGAPDLDFGFWNVPTEDLVHFFEEMGIKTGISLGPLLECVKIAEKLARRTLPGHLRSAGASSDLRKIPEGIITYS